MSVIHRIITMNLFFNRSFVAPPDPDVGRFDRFAKCATPARVNEVRARRNFGFSGRYCRRGVHLLPPWDFTAGLFYGNSYPQYVL